MKVLSNIYQTLGALDLCSTKKSLQSCRKKPTLQGCGTIYQNLKNNKIGKPLSKGNKNFLTSFGRFMCYGSLSGLFCTTLTKGNIVYRQKSK